MKCEEKISTELLNETQAASYIGKPPEFLQCRRTDTKTKHRPPGPPFVHAPVSRAALYQTEDLKSWLEDYPHATKTAEERYLLARSQRASTSTPVKTFSELLVDLETWLGAHRPVYLKGFNDPARQDQLDQFEEPIGLKLPKEYRLLMSWRDGHKGEHSAILDPFEHDQGLLSVARTESTIQCLNNLLKEGLFDEEQWPPDWLPFMGDMFGNNICIDLSSQQYGKLFYCSPEVGNFDVSEDLTTWLARLVGRLQYLDVQLWEREFRPFF